MSDRTSPGLRPASSVSEYYERYWLPPDRRPPDVTRPQLIDTPFPAVARLFDRWIPGTARCLDVGCGHGHAAGRPLTATGRTYVGVDISATAVAEARSIGLDARQIEDAAALPFADGEFDALTFTYLLRYVDDPLATMCELARVVRPRGVVAMLEFDVPRGVWRPLWELYVRVGLPLAGAVVSPAWREVGGFLGPSIRAFHERVSLEQLWRDAGLDAVQTRRLSLGGGVVVWGIRP